MTVWMMWLAGAGLMVIFEMLTGTFYLLMIGIGLAAGGLAALAGASPGFQFAIAALIGIAGTYGLRRSGFGRASKTEARCDPNVNLDIGQALMIREWRNASGGIYLTRTNYRGADWDVELQPGEEAKDGWFVIREVRGSQLIVANKRD